MDFEKLFVPYHIAGKLKKIGFDEQCLRAYNSLYLFYYSKDWDFALIKNSELEDGHAAPMYEQVINWFEDKHNIFIETSRDLVDKDFSSVIKDGNTMRMHSRINNFNVNKQHALVELIEEAIKLISNKK